jgi:prolipoprotein diacylglyceryltransferase
VLPLAILVSNQLPGVAPLPVLPTLAAVSIAYVIGEGLGRLGCISFGCCYGKPVDALPPRVARLFGTRAVVFQGATKKIAYASGLEGVRVVPVQAMTSVAYLAAGLVGTLLFLHSCYAAALLATLAVAQLWRAFSETLRADHRGGGRLTVYQGMSLFAAALAMVCAAGLAGQPAPTASLARGFQQLWRPDVILILEASGIAMFLYTGWSMVTGSVLSFHVHEDRI